MKKERIESAESSEIRIALFNISTLEDIRVEFLGGVYTEIKLLLRKKLFS